jgi:hypothetical protein
LQLQSSITTVCLEAFEHLTKAHPYLDITLTRFSDRIEVLLSHIDEDSAAASRNTTAGLAGQAGGMPGKACAFAGIDRARYETRDGESVTRLTKYIGKVSPRV